MTAARMRRAAAGALAVGLLAVGACNPAGSGSSQSSQGQSEGRPFVIGRTGAVGKLDPAKATSFTDVQTLDLVYGTLLETTAEGELESGLAREWQVSEDGTKITFTLRQGVKFHEGSALTAADVKATLERILAEKTGSVVRSYFLDIKRIATPSKDTVVLRLDKPNASLLYALTQVGASILNKQDITAGTVARKPNGTGPFRWVSWNQGRQVVLGANNGWWGQTPALSRIEFRVIPDESSIMSAVKAGSLNLGLLSNPNIARQAKGSNATLVAQPTLAYHVLMLNGRRGPLKKVKARQAIACAIDRRQIIETVYFGYGKVTGPITSPAFSYDPTAGLPCNPPDREKAKQLLAEAGLAGGFELTTPVLVGNYATSTAVAQSLQAQLKKIGVQLNLKQQQTNVFVDNWLKANFDAAVTKNGGSFDPYLMYGRYFTSSGSLTKPAGLSESTLNQLLQKGKAATDSQQRKETFRTLQRELLELSPWVWLFNDTRFYLLGPNVKGFKATPNGSLEPLVTTRREG